MIFEQQVKVTDPSYKTYESTLFETYKTLLSDATKDMKIVMMRDIRNKFPYFKHTMPKVMAIAYYLHKVASMDTQSDIPTIKEVKTVAPVYPYRSGTLPFNQELAITSVESVFRDYTTNKNKHLIVLDVARYYEHLSK